MSFIRKPKHWGWWIAGAVTGAVAFIVMPEGPWYRQFGAVVLVLLAEGMVEESHKP